MIPLAALLLTQASPAMQLPALGPVEMFRAACTQGSLALSRSNAAQVRYESLPAHARMVLGQAIAPPGETYFTAAPEAADVPGPVYSVGAGHDTYLLLPASDAAQDKAQAGGFAKSCEVVWKGEHFLEARAAILTETPPLLSGQDPSANSDGQAFVGNISGNLYLSAATLRGWTVLRSVPRSDAPIP